MSRSVVALPSDLVGAVKDKRLELFVGAGASAAASLMAWDALIREMAAQIRREATGYAPAKLDAFLAKADHLDIAEQFRETVKDRAFIAFLRSQYRRPVTPANLHRALARLSVTTVFTTNYDKLLETAFARATALIRW